MTPDQIRTIQIARRKVGLAEEQYRMLLRNVAGVSSCKQLDNASLEDVMAVLEDLAENQQTRLSNHEPDYWRKKVLARGSVAGERMARKIRDLASQQDRYPLEALCRRHSDNRTAIAEQLTPREA